MRIYERPDLGWRICMTRAWVTAPSGRPVEELLPEGTAWEWAELLAEKTSQERRMAILEGRAKSGATKPIDLGQLFTKYHASAEAQDWSAKHQDDKDRCRRYWEASLDPATPVLDLTPALVEKKARQGRERGAWTSRWDRKRLAYLRSAVLWGLNKARLYDVNPLRGLELPDYTPQTEELVYSAREMMLLATPHPEVDWRVTLASSIIADTGRRISAVLSISAVRDLVLLPVQGAERLHVVYRREWDKGRRGSVVPASAETAQLVAEALERPEVQESGWLFPEGRLEYDDPTDKPMGKDAMTEALHRAEVALGIPYVPGRAWHGQKRGHVTASWEEASGDAGLVGDLTGNVSASLLKDIYRQFGRKRTTTHVDRVRQRLKAEAEEEG
ncbi:MAG: hypothetical protein QME96_05830 [Myxococcota bacterium]|nr:hypothetical protein [Myxococcota bacterium]